MRKNLRPFQETGAQFLKSHYHALLADEPGLGKTLQAIAAAEMLGLKRILVVCPASVRLNWYQEIRECLGSIKGWRVVSYNEMVLRRVSELSTFHALILDESHFLKNIDSKRTQAIFKNKIGVARHCQYKWALTGTPILNRPVELYPLLKTLNPVFKNMSFSKYGQRYCGSYFDGRAMNMRGASNLGELAGMLKGFMLRRTKLEVMPELPKRIISRVPLELKPSDLKLIEDAEREIGDRETYISSIRENYSQLGDLSHLLRLTGNAKIHTVVSYIKDLLETVKKVVMFAKHRDVIMQIGAQLNRHDIAVVYYRGGMSDSEKQDAVNLFRENPFYKVFIGNIQAAGIGINGLQDKCHEVVFAELSWVPGEMSQAIDRVHRIGQQAESVNVHVLHAPGTLESAVLAVNDGKTRVIDKLMGERAGYEILGDLV